MHGSGSPGLAVQIRVGYINLPRSILLPPTKHRFSLFPKDGVLQQMELCSVAPVLKKPQDRRYVRHELRLSSNLSNDYLCFRSIRHPT